MIVLEPASEAVVHWPLLSGGYASPGDLRPLILSYSSDLNRAHCVCLGELVNVYIFTRTYKICINIH